MHFCPKCENLLYIKKIEGQLQHHCKNCFWSGPYMNEGGEDDSNRIIVYEKKYNNDDFISDSIVSNPNIIYDATLPRINNINCINTICSSNIKSNLAIRMEISYKDDTASKDIIENVNNVCLNFITSQGISIDKYNIIKLSHTTYIVQFKNTSQQQQINALNRVEYGKYTIQMKPFIPTDNEIIFIKYNEKKLKYLYICAHCKTSWKK
jgi:DNA-directed RNA polymerase subunit M/transcription elongation factor TFIIS